MSKLEEYLEQFPFDLTEEERKEAEQELAELEKQNAIDEQEELENPFLQEKVIPIDEIQKRRENRKKTAASEEESIPLYDEVMEAVYPKENDNLDLPLTVDDEKEENEKGTSPRQEIDSLENELESSLLDYDSDFTLFINIDVKGRRYFIKVDEDREIPLSNFLILPLYSIEDEEGKRKDIVRIFNNKQSKVVILDAETKSINRQFKTFVLENGKFNWLGGQKDLDQLVQLILSYDTEEITEISYVGWNEKEKGWFFPTHAYVDGEVYFPNEDKIFKTKKKNYILDQNEAFGIVAEHIYDKPTKEDIITTLANYQTLYHTYGWLGIGFTVSSMHVNEFAKKTKQHPFLYAHGMRNSGKTEYLKTVFRFAGMDTRLPPPPRLDGLRKRLAWFSHLPIGYDEAEEKSIKTMDFFVKNRESLNTIFNRTSLERGTNDPNKLLYFPVRGTLAFGGEVATSDSAITTRTVFIDALKIVQDEKAFDELEQNVEIMYWLGQYMMRTSLEWKEMLYDNFDMINNHFKKVEGVSGRVRKNFSMLAAGAVTFTQWVDKEFGSQVYTGAFLQSLLTEIENEMIEGQQEAESNHHAITYLKDLSYLARKYKLVNQSDYKVVENFLYIAPESSWRAYEEWKKNPHYASSRKVANDLKAYQFFLGTERIRIGGHQKRWWKIDLSKFPDEDLQGFLDVDDCR